MKISQTYNFENHSTLWKTGVPEGKELLFNLYTRKPDAAAVLPDSQDG